MGAGHWLAGLERYRLEFHPDQQTYESYEYVSGDIGLDAKIGLALSADGKGIRTEPMSARHMSPETARRMAAELLRAADFAESRGCHPGFPAWPGMR